MKFFADRFGDEYPVSEIVRIARVLGERGDKPPYKTRYQTVYLRDGERVEVAEYTVEEITNAPVHMIPAPAGTFLLGGFDVTDTSPDEIFQTPVIAFGIGGDGIVKPWTVDGPDDGVSNPGPLLMPNGMVIEQAMCCYPTLKDWFDDKHAEKVRAASASPAPGTAD
jgi:hypothetical protein